MVFFQLKAEGLISQLSVAIRARTRVNRIGAHQEICWAKEGIHSPNPVPHCHVQQHQAHSYVILLGIWPGDARKCSKILHECQHRVAKNIDDKVVQSSYRLFFTKLIQSNISNKLTKKEEQLLQRWGSGRPASSLWHENATVAWLSFLLRKVCPAAGEFMLWMYFPYTGELTVPLFGTKEQLSPSPCLPDWHCQTLSHHTITRQTGFYWVHSQKFLCKLPPVPGAECTCKLLLG